MHDVPYSNFSSSTTSKSCPEITAAMTRICSDVKRVLAPTKMPCGIQVLYSLLLNYMMIYFKIMLTY